MANENFTAQQWIEYFFKKLEKDETVTVNDLREAVKTISVHDSVAASDALTVLYSGEGDAFPRALAEKAGSRVRMIDHTEAYKFLSHKRFDSLFREVLSGELPDMDTSSKVFENLHDSILFDASSGSFTGGTWEASDSFWSIVSRRFASETSGDVYALCVNAGPERIFAKDELKTLMDVLPDNARIGGFLKSEYAGLDDAGFIAGVEEYAAAKNLPWVSGSAGYRGKTAADSGLSDSGQDYSVLSESSGCGSAVCNSGSSVEARQRVRFRIRRSRARRAVCARSAVGMLNAGTLNADKLSFSRKSAADMPESGRQAEFAAVCIRHARFAQTRLAQTRLAQTWLAQIRLAQTRFSQIRLAQAEREHARLAADKQRETFV